MKDLHFLILFGLLCGVCLCKDEINLPPDGDRLTFVKGTTGKIEWSISKDVMSTVTSRSWNFIDRSGKSKLIAQINSNKDVVIKNSTLPGVAIQEPTTLILKDVDHRYNGVYRFSISGDVAALSDVTVDIVVTPTVTTDCPGLGPVNKGDDIQCVCEGKGGIPPANVTWYDKAGKKIGETGNEMQTLRLPNVNQKDRGQYTCVAKNHKDSENATSFVLTVNYPPENVRVVLPSEIAVRGKSFTIKCGADGNPLPTFKIFFNETELPISGVIYTIPKVDDGHVGFYKCVANNSLGTSESKPLYLDVGNAEIHRDDDGGVGTGAIVGIVIGVLVFVLIIVLLYLFVFKKKNNDHERVRSESGRATEQPVSKSNQPPEYATLEPPEQLTYAALDKKALKQGAGGKPASASTPTEYAAIQVS